MLATNANSSPHKKINLNTILNLFMKKIKYACDQCEFKSSQKDQLEHHIKSVHEKNEICFRPLRIQVITKRSTWTPYLINIRGIFSTWKISSFMNRSSVHSQPINLRQLFTTLFTWKISSFMNRSIVHAQHINLHGKYLASWTDLLCTPNL